MTSKQSVGYHSIVAALNPGSTHQPAAIRSANVAEKLQSEVTLAQISATKSVESSGQQTSDVISQLSSAHPTISGVKSAQGNWLQIIKLADEVSGDLIVLDDIVYAELAPLLIESSQNACNHGDCDVLIVHTRTRSSDTPVQDYQNIVVAADLNDQGLMTIYKAVRMAKRYQSRLTLLNVLEASGVENEESMIQRRLRGLDAFTSVIEGLEVEKEVTVTKEQVGTAVCQFTNQHSADLIVIGSHKFKGLCVLHGQKAQQVLKDCACDVLVVHE